MDKYLILALTIFLQLSCSFCNAQSGAVHPAKQRPHDWWQADWKKDSLPGISLDEAYAYLKGRKSKPLIVAILDECIDTSHEDLKGILWTNKKEIPGNVIDDDKSGYTDDVHGWCFVCGKTGISQNKELSGEARTYITWREKFEHIDTNKLAGSLKVQYEMYQTAKEMLFATYRFQQLARTMEADTVKFIKYLDNLSGRYSDSTMDKIPFDTLPFSNPYDSSENIFWSIFMKKIMSPNPPPLKIWTSILKRPDYPSNQFFKEAGINDDTSDTLKNFRGVVGDDDNNFNKKYGAPNIEPVDHRAYHATFIAGIIAANRKNDIGIKGTADNVLIMPLIITNNSIRDKDIVFAILYAVDNGASIINFSIAGAFGEHLKEMREAFDYASKKGVLIVSGAGNYSANLDNEKYYMGQRADGNTRDEFIRVGATTSALNENLVSTFSNYGNGRLTCSRQELLFIQPFRATKMIMITEQAFLVR